MVALGTTLFVFMGGIFFSLSISVVAALTLWEFYKLTIHDFTNFENLLLIVFGLFNSIVLVLTAHFSGVSTSILILSFNVVGTAFLSVTVFRSNNNFLEIVIKQTFGLIYIPISLSFLVVIRIYD